MVNPFGANMSEKFSSMGKDFILFASKASRLIDNDKTQQALDLCEAGVRNFPFYAPGHYILGLCYDAVDKKEDAKDEFERTLVYDPSHSKAMRKLSGFYQNSGLQQIANEWLVKEALYNPLDQSLISVLKEKDLYGQLNPAPNGTDYAVKEDAVVEKEGTESDALESSEPDKPSQKEALIDGEKDSGQKEDIIPVEEKDSEEDGLIDSLDPLAENIVLDEKKGDFPEGGKEAKKDLDQFANMEDDFSTVMDGYFDKDEESGSQSSDGDEWIEVENLLIDEEVSTSAQDSTETIEHDTIDETERLLEQLSDLETEEKAVEENLEEPIEEENTLAPDTQIGDPAPDDVGEPVPSSTPDVAPGPVAENNPAPELSGEEEVTIKDLVENPNLVTPTFGEILVSQHNFSEARHIFMELLKREPDNQRFIKKVQFLDKFLEAQKA